MSNTVTNVSTGKPVGSGAIWRAPYGTTLPTDATGTLNSAFVAIGYISEDGVTNANSPSSENIKAWGGDVVLTTQSEKTDTFKFKMLEVLNTEVLKAIYGDDNVSGALATGITVRANNDEQAAAAYVIDMALRGGVKKRIVIPNAKLTELSEVVYKDNEAIGYEATLTAMSGGFGSSDADTHKEYIKTIPSGQSGTS